MSIGPWRISSVGTLWRHAGGRTHREHPESRQPPDELPAQWRGFAVMMKGIPGSPDGSFLGRVWTSGYTPGKCGQAPKLRTSGSDMYSSAPSAYTATRTTVRSTHPHASASEDVAEVEVDVRPLKVTREHSSTYLRQPRHAPAPADCRRTP
jgi:hypothetical protein